MVDGGYVSYINVIKDINNRSIHNMARAVPLDSSKNDFFGILHQKHQLKYIDEK